MARNLPKYVHTEVSRHGKRVYYYRRANKRTRLPGAFMSEEFKRVLQAAEAAETASRAPPPTFDTLQKGAVEKRLVDAVRAARTRARTKRLEFDLDLAWALAAVERQSFRCALTDFPFYAEKNAGSKADPFAPSFDRIDCRRGYTRDNTRIVIYAINVMMMDWGEELFARIAGRYRYAKGRKPEQATPEPLRKCGP